MGENGGCLKWIGFASFIVALLIWINNVDTIVVKEQIPPPQDSWEVVYPKFRDEVSEQLLNTQEMVGLTLDDTRYIQEQNIDIQYSIDILLNALGVIQQKAEEENKRQRFEQWFATFLSIVLGWLLAAFVPTEETLIKFRNRFSGKPTSSLEHDLVNGKDSQASRANISFLELLVTDKFARSLVIIIVILSVAIVVLFVIEYFL